MIQCPSLAHWVTCIYNHLMKADSHPYHDCLCFNVRRLTRRLTHVYDRHLAEAGLTITQFSLLTALDTAGTEGIAMSAFARAMDMDSSTLTRTLRVLEREGLIRITHGKDRRQRRAKLTEAGAQRLREAQPYWHRAQDEMTAALGPEAIGAIRRFLHHSPPL